MGHPQPHDLRRVARRLEAYASTRDTRVAMSIAHVIAEPGCNTTGCISGHYAAARLLETCSPPATDPDGRVLNDDGIAIHFLDGAFLMARDLGFASEDELTAWAASNPDAWGNPHGAYMFNSGSAWNPDDCLTLNRAAHHLHEIASRLDDEADKGEHVNRGSNHNEKPLKGTKPVTDKAKTALQAERKNKESALTILRHAQQIVESGWFEPRTRRVSEMLLGSLSEATREIWKKDSNTAIPQLKGQLFSRPEADWALRYVCLSLPKPTEGRSASHRLRKIDGWSLNKYVRQETILHVLDNAQALAKKDVSTTRERIQVGNSRTKRPKLAPWKPSDYVFRLSEPQGILEHLPTEKAKDKTYVVRLQPGHVASDQTLALAAERHGLKLYQPEDRFIDIPAYRRMPAIVRMRTVLDMPGGREIAYEAGSYDETNHAFNELTLRNGGLAHDDERRIVFVERLHLHLKTVQGDAEKLEDKTADLILDVPYTCLTGWDNRKMRTIPIVSSSLLKEFDEETYARLVTACILIFPDGDPAESPLRNARKLARMSVAMPPAIRRNRNTE